MDVLGIDISKDDFHACLIQGAKRSKHSFPNASSGYKQLQRWLKNRKSAPVHACMEATGAYWLGLASAMHECGATVSVVNPARTALYARSQLRRTKTDSVDCEMIADFCNTQPLEQWTPPAPETLELRGILSYREHLVNQRTQCKQIVGQISVSAQLKRLHTKQLKVLEQTIAALETEMQAIIGKHPLLHADVMRVQSIPGIGFLSAVSLVAKLPMERIRDSKAAAAYAGVTPSERQSGTSVHGKPRICKTGNASLRRDLYMPALVAIRYNPTLKTFAERLRARGKAPKVVIVAVMRKLIVLAYTLLKKGEAFSLQPTP